MLPISVVIPHQPSRESFFREVCLPSIQKNEPAQIIIRTFESISVQKKRNLGAADAKHPYLIFIDDDIELHEGCLSRMFEELKVAQDSIGYVYCDYRIQCHGQWRHPSEPLFAAQDYQYESLKQGNYVSMISLIKKEVFPGFDESVRRLQDWDLWLTIGKNGHAGKYIPEALFTAHYHDDSISARESMEEADAYIRRKHGL